MPPETGPQDRPEPTAEQAAAAPRSDRPETWAARLHDQTVLAIDYGLRRIGLAVKPAGADQALPLGIVPGEPTLRAVEAIRAVIADRAVTCVVTGLPLHDDPTQLRLTKKFVRKLREEVRGVRWRFADESHTTGEAHHRRQEADLSGRAARGRARPIDDRAAALILESFLNSPAEEDWE